jgi:hypothetical protein
MLTGLKTKKSPRSLCKVEATAREAEASMRLNDPSLWVADSIMLTSVRCSLLHNVVTRTCSVAGEQCFDSKARL